MRRKVRQKEKEVGLPRGRPVAGRKKERGKDQPKWESHGQKKTPAAVRCKERDEKRASCYAVGWSRMVF